MLFPCRWKYEDEEGAAKGDQYIMRGIDAMIDAILTPKHEALGMGGFTRNVKVTGRKRGRTKRVMYV